MISKAYIEISLNSNEEKFTLTFLGLILKPKKCWRWKNSNRYIYLELEQNLLSEIFQDEILNREILDSTIYQY